MGNISKKPRGKPFPPGVSGNPYGRPLKGETLRDLLVEVGNERIGTYKERPLLRKHQFVRDCYNLANQGPQYAKIIWEQQEGAPDQTVNAKVLNRTETIDLSKLPTADVEKLREIVKKAHIDDGK